LPGFVLQERQLAIELHRDGVPRVALEQGDDARERRARLDFARHDPQLEPHQVDQLGGLVLALIELDAGLAEATGVDHSPDAGEPLAEPVRTRLRFTSHLDHETV